MHMYTLLYLKWSTKKELLCSTWTLLNVMLQSGEWINEYIRLSPFTVHLLTILTTLLIGYTPMQNIKLKKNNVKLKDKMMLYLLILKFIILFPA